jgi:hypothetical protein
MSVEGFGNSRRIERPKGWGDRLRPGEVLTIERTRYNHPFFCKIKSSQGRVMYGSEYCYYSGLAPANHPLPVIRSEL